MEPALETCMNGQVDSADAPLLHPSPQARDSYKFVAVESLGHSVGHRWRGGARKPLEHTALHDHVLFSDGCNVEGVFVPNKEQDAHGQQLLTVSPRKFCMQLVHYIPEWPGPKR
eukprot:13577722-Alexandrium_andersonii.AAC.1